jgi:hypothetical protein
MSQYDVARRLPRLFGRRLILIAKSQPRSPPDAPESDVSRRTWLAPSGHGSRGGVRDWVQPPSPSPSPSPSVGYCRA